MQEYKRLSLLILIMTAVAVIIGATAIYLIYQGGLERERLRLQDVVRSNARLLESIASFDKIYSTYPDGPLAGALSQFIEAHRNFTLQSLGQTGEITLARREGDGIVFLLRERQPDPDSADAVPFASALAEPMRAALAGQSGTMVGLDYAGRRVLAAYKPVAQLDLGLVAKIDLDEIRQGFTRSAGILALIALIAIGGASALFFGITEPMIRRLRQSETRFRELFENMTGGAAVFQAVADGQDFTFRDFNRRGEEIANISRNAVIGRKVTDRFPGVRALGLLDAMREVWRTGKPQSLPSGYYHDERIQGWRDSYVYKLPSGEVVTLFDDVTERKQAEEALRESEARLRGTFENAAVGIAHVGFNGAWLRVNQRLCEIVGYSRELLVQKTFQDITHPDDLAADVARFGLLLRGEIGSYSLEKRYFRKDGRLVWVNLTTALQRDDFGRPLYCISIVEDISARKRAEQALQDSETRMRALLDASQDDGLLVSTEGTILAINKAARQRLARRIAGNDPIGAHLGQLLPRDLAEARLATIREVAALAAPTQSETLIRGRWFEFWFYPVAQPDRAVTEVAVYARDITRRKHAENELRRLYQAIQQSPASIVITDPRGDIVYVNPAFSECTGYAYEDVIGQNPRILKSGYIAPEVYATLWSTITHGEVWRGELQNRKKNGDVFWELASIAPVKDERGQIISFVAVKEDITERRATEAQLRQAQKMDAIGQLTGGIAHDFNNLLTIILGNLQLLEEALENDESLKLLVMDGLWSAKRGAELTHRLLAFARRQPLNPTSVNLNDVVYGLTDLLRRTLGSTVKVREDLAPDVLPVLVDTGELERALVNLAINARDAMPDGGVLTLQTANASLDEVDTDQFADVARGRYVMLAVTDTGVGIPAEALTRIFEPFFTTKELGRGSGLGLSMVYGFVRQSGGHVSVESEVGTGTTFKLFFVAEPAIAGAGSVTGR